MQPPFLFGLGSWFAFIIASIVSIYVFDVFEHAWGRGGSLQVEAWVGLLGGFICMVSFGFSAAFTKRAHTKPATFLLGVASGALYVSTCFAISVYAPATGVLSAVLLLIAMSAAASQVAPRHAG
jgi:hypothetical protein